MEGWDGVAGKEGERVRLLHETAELKALVASLRESEARLHTIFEHSPLSIWVEDFSAVRERFEQLRREGVRDFGSHFAAHPEDVARCAALVRVIDVNQTSVRFFGAPSKEALEIRLPVYFTEESLAAFRRELVALAEGKTMFEGEIPIRSPSGERLILLLSLSVLPHCRETLERVIVSFTDVSAHRRAEEALQASEGRYRGLFESMQEGFALGEILWDADGRPHDFRYVEVNPAFCRLTGLDPDQAKRLTARELFNVFDPWWLETYARVAAGGGPAHFERQSPSLLKWWEIYAYSPEPGRFAILVTDIGERKRMEMDLRHSEGRFRALFDYAPIAYQSLDEEGRFLEVNQVWLNTLGYRKDEVLGRWFGDFLHPKDRPLLRTRFPRFWELGEVHGAEFRLRCRDGQEVLASFDGKISGGPEGTARRSHCIFRDITEQRRAEEALRGSARLFRSWFDLGLIGVAVISPDGRFCRVNEKLCAILGYSRKELLNLTWMDLTPPEELEEELPRYSQFFSDERDGSDFEKHFRRADGSPLTVFLSTRTVRKPDGRPDYLVAVFLDLTDRKKLEAQLLQAQKMETVGRLAGGVAHDFNNLLTIIAGNADIGLAGLDPEAPLFEELTEIRRAAERAAELTRKLLAFSRRQIAEPRWIDLNDVLKDMERMLRRLIGEHIELITTLAADMPAVRIDPGQVEQVLTNLAVNSRDAMPEGGRLTIATSFERLAESFCRSHPGSKPGEYVRLRVEDTGCGMGEEVRAHLFEPFFTTKPKGSGTGLGLSTCYGIVKQNGGSIWVDSAPGKGTKVSVYLPAGGPRPGLQPKPAKPAREELPGGSETVLLVEDEPGIRRTAARILSGCGYRVLSASGGEEALMLAGKAAEPAALLLTDVVMPGMSGNELAGRLERRWPALKVLYMSGYTEESFVQHGIVQEGIFFLHKPFSSTALAVKVRETLDAARPPAGGQPGD